MELLCKKNGSGNDKPRVYFTCHPDDYTLYFERITNDILKLYDCAIFYASDMSAEITDYEDFFSGGRINLFVIPVTKKLLTTPNRAMDSDFPYAAGNIPVLPLMMEPNLDALYERPDRFGTLQYLNPESVDSTEIRYEKKLEDFLDSVLLGKELIQKIMSEFNSRVFLSYRKKDRMHANKLLKAIHHNPECFDVAVWFDEFLTPSEDYVSNIQKIMEDSEAFILLVTPNLLEYPDGKPNFVMDKEYPAARDSGKTILPVEMVPTDRDELRSAYTGLTDPVDFGDRESFEKAIGDCLSKIAREDRRRGPEHDYYIGLAYLNGIGVECDRKRGIQLITSAAQRGYESAMWKLYDAYQNGLGVLRNPDEAARWIKAFNDATGSTDTVEYMEASFAAMERALLSSEKDREAVENETQKAKENITELWEASLDAKSDQVEAYTLSGRYKDAASLGEETYAQHVEHLGRTHRQTIKSQRILAHAYFRSGNIDKALSLFEESYNTSSKTYGENDTDTLVLLCFLAMAYGDAGYHQKAIDSFEIAFSKLCETAGERSNAVLWAQSLFADMCNEAGLHSKAFDLLTNLFYKSRLCLGENSSTTEDALKEIKETAAEPEVYEAAAEFFLTLVEYNRQKYGGNSKKTIEATEELVNAYERLEKYREAIEYARAVNDAYFSVYGLQDPRAFTFFHKLSMLSFQWGKREGKRYRKTVRKHGRRSVEAAEALSNLIEMFKFVESYDAALLTGKKLYKLQVKLFGRKDDRTLATLTDMEDFCQKTDTERLAAKMLKFIAGERNKD